ncbi:MAG: GNAT family N-acetyltransferase [Planctomycetota bacterium]
MQEYRFRPYAPGDEAAILATFNRTFREVCGPDFVDRGLAEWRWEFADNPAGMRVELALAPDGTVAAQYAGVPMRVWTTVGGGRELSFFHAVDSMVHPDHRKGLRKKPLFVEIAERFFERVGGRLDDLGFGYPVRPAWRIGERYLGYGLIRVLDFLLRDAAAPLAAPAGVEVAPLREATAELDDLEARLRGRHPCTTIKDRRYVAWRYLAAPKGYEVLGARRDGVLVGWAAVRGEGSLVPGALTIGDHACDPEDAEVLRALVAAARDRAVRDGKDALLTVQNPRLAPFAALLALGFVERPSGDWLERKLGSRDWTAGLDQAWLAEHWQYALGDSDLF